MDGGASFHYFFKFGICRGVGAPRKGGEECAIYRSLSAQHVSNELLAGDMRHYYWRVTSRIRPYLPTGTLRLQFAGGLPCGSCRATARYD
jgi:hypothetical protein